ncbi:MAG: nucleotide exchange factor GrpE [Dehalococcoidia bacterium]
MGIEPEQLSEEADPEAPPKVQLERLKAELEEADRERTQFKNLLQRVQADFVNYKRRAEEERVEQERQATARLVEQLLPLLDEFRLALDHAEREEHHATWLEGVRLLEKKLQNILEAEGLSRIEAQGKAFDPWEHEALSYQESTEHAEGQVIEVLREGYKLHGRVLRPAQVVVARPPQLSTDKMEPSSEEKEG